MMYPIVRYFHLTFPMAFLRRCCTKGGPDSAKHAAEGGRRAGGRHPRIISGKWVVNGNVRDRICLEIFQANFACFKFGCFFVSWKLRAMNIGEFGRVLWKFVFFWDTIFQIRIFAIRICDMYLHESVHNFNQTIVWALASSKGWTFRMVPWKQELVA